MITDAPSPRARRGRHALVAAAIGCALLTGCTSTISGQAIRDPDAAPADIELLEESQLDDVLVSIGDVNDIMSASEMEVAGELDEMVDNSGIVSEPDCLASILGAEEVVYGDSGYTAVRKQVASEPYDENDHWVEQAAVLYESAAEAQQFFDFSRSIWESCAGTSIGIEDEIDMSNWQIEDVTATDTVLTQLTTQDNSGGWECQHSLAVVSNATMEAWACSYGARDEATEIAAKMADNAAR